MTTQSTEIEGDEGENEAIVTSAPPASGKLRQRLRERQSPTTPMMTNPLGDPVEPPKTGAVIDDDTEVKSDTPDLDRVVARGITMTKAQKQMREDEDKSIIDWLKNLEGEAPIKVQVKRREPKEFVDPATGRRLNVGGHLRTYDRAIDEEEIQRNHGGGVIQLTVQKKDARGHYVYMTAKTIEISGDPRTDDVPRATVPLKDERPVANPLETPLMGKLVDNLLTNRNAPGPDVSSSIQTAMQPIIDSNRRLEQQLDRKDRELAEVRSSIGQRDPNEVTFQQRLLDKMIDGDSARVNALRTQFESELRMVKEAALANESRIRDQADRDREHLHRSHEREISVLKQSYDTKLASVEGSSAIARAAIEQSATLTKALLESENRRMERELTELRLEVKELRNTKNPSLKDKISEIRDYKELIGDLGDGDDDEKKSGLMKFVEGAAQSDVIGGFVQRIVSGGGAPGASPPQQLAPPPVQVPPRRRGPRLLRDKRNGQVYATDGQKAIPVVRKQPLAPPQSPPVVLDDQGAAVTMPEVPEPPVEVKPEVPIPYIDPMQVKMATDYLTNAFNNKTDPQACASSVQAFIPKEIMAALAAMGVDDFLAKVGGIDQSMPLGSQLGRRWARRVAGFLLGES